MVVKPKRLEHGDTIGIVAPAWSFDQERFMKGVDYLRALGFRVKYDRRIFSKYWSMAGHDKERAEQINAMFADPEVRAILCAKAGYGSIRTLPYLDGKLIRRNPKAFVGYSDITALLSYLARVANMVVFHGPVVSGEIHADMNEGTLRSLLRALMNDEAQGKIMHPDMRCLRRGRAVGPIVGGNMSLLISTIGTDYDLETDGCILFLEDIGEDLEMIDNYLMHLKLAGKLRKVKGLVFGRMIDCRDDSGHLYTIEKILRDILTDVDVPILSGFPSGHRMVGDLNITLPMGASVAIESSPPSLVIREGGVS
jgi:muramoyltetrapeptide carboxypeptidase